MTKTIANQPVKKLYNTEIRSVDEENHTIRFRVSDDSEDRYGESVKQDWQLDNFQKNPIGIWNHRGGREIEPEDVMATWKDFETVGKETFATAQFDEQNPKALFVFGQYARKFLRAVSVGFIPHNISFEDDTPVLGENELLEISFVPIPANPNAISLGVKSGDIRLEDAQWLSKSMDDARKSLEAQIEAQTKDGDDAADVDARFKALEESIADLATKLGAAVDEIRDVAKKLDTTDEEEEKDPPTDPAKGGDDDQPGAEGEEDEIDLETELTDEELDALEIDEEETTE
jgi:hypothetical protein